MTVKAMTPHERSLGTAQRDLADRAESVVRFSARQMFERLMKLRENIGVRSYEGLPVDEDELNARWGSLRHDEEGAFKALAANTRTGRDGRLLIKRDLAQRITKLEDKFREAGVP